MAKVFSRSVGMFALIANSRPSKPDLMGFIGVFLFDVFLEGGLQGPPVEWSATTDARACDLKGRARFWWWLDGGIWR